ncbi:hypothetical protein QBD00_003742 [Ochrobactrum sp. AN78]|nr:hypothetical protein [Ochrobactrum sp. AN78]
MRTNDGQLLPVDAVARGLAIGPVVDEARLYENFEMLRYGGLGKVETPDNVLTTAGILKDQLPKYVNTNGMPERSIYARRKIIIHARKNIGHRFNRNLHRKSTIYDYTQKINITQRPY